MVVKVYDAPNGGNLTYQENIGIVAVTNGTYSFQFGDEGDGIIAVLIGFSDYLSLTVNGTEEATRTKLLAVPYSLKSADAQALAGKVESVSGNVTTIQSQTASLTSNLTALQGQSAALTSNVTTLQGQTGNLSSNLTSLQSQTSGLSSNLTGLRQDLAVSAVTEPASVTTLAGSGNAAFVDASGIAASFNGPNSVAVDNSGNVYVADQFNHRIRRVSPSGVVTTLAGSGVAGFANGNGTAAQFDDPMGIAVDASGNVYVGEADNRRVRRITPTGVVTTFAGSGVSGSTDGNGTAASFVSPIDLAVDSSGNVYVGDHGGHRIRKISPSGVVTTLAGSGVAGYVDGNGTAAQFNNPNGVALDASGNVYVADQANQRIRKISPAGVVTTLAGSGNASFSDGTGTAVSFNVPCGIAVDGSGNVYVTDGSNNRIRKITPAGVVTTLAGTGSAFFADGIASSAGFNNPGGVAVDSSGALYIGDSWNNRIRKIQP